MAEGPANVRRASSEDWRGLRSIRLESLSDTPEAYGSTYAESFTWTDERWRAAAARWTYFLAERDDRVVGMVSGGANDHHPGTRWLYAMYVTSPERATGTAARLVEAVGEWAREEGVPQLYLHVTSSVARARAFYEKMGFVPTGDTITMDRDPSITLLTMVRELD
jgi:GNAT superfamily N-acetyltransferase